MIYDFPLEMQMKSLKFINLASECQFRIKEYKYCILVY